MPTIVRGNNTWFDKIPGKDLGYTYPNKLNLTPGSALHNRIITEVMNRALDSHTVMARKHLKWNKIDQTLTTFITIDEEERVVREKDPRKPVSIVVPYSYATLETLLTYWVATFLELPYFKYEGVTSDDIIGSIMLEKIIEMQCLNNKIGLSLHTQFRDSLVYGFGVSVPLWTEKLGWRSFIDQAGVRQRTREVLFEGNRLENIDPYLYLPDPSVPIHDPQRGEFVGWIQKTNYMSLLSDEVNSGGDIYNVKYLKGQNCLSRLLIGSLGSGNSDREKGVGGDIRQSMIIRGTQSPVDVIWMCITLVPSDSTWRLGKSDIPEKWIFGIAADNVVICAQPLGLDHDNYPVSICVPDYDGYSVSPISRVELIHGLQGVLDFLFSSHMANVRKAINDMIIVDPFLVNMGDMRDPKPGKLIRTRRAAWGRGVQNVAMQLNVSDITRGNMADSSLVMDVMQRTSSATDVVQGIMRSGSERRSATESKSVEKGALSRIAKSTKIASMMCMYDIAYMLASQTQQFASRQVFVSSFGRYQQELIEEYGDQLQGNRGLKVNPNDLLIKYNTLIHDGTMDTGEFAQEWTQIWQVLSTNPSVGAGFDMVRIFKHMARLMGAKSINDFVRKGGSANIKMMQDQLVQSEVQKGNMKSLGAGGGMGE